MPDKLIGDRAHHPSLRLAAGQVDTFPRVSSVPTSRCNYCGQLLTNATYHPEYSWTIGLTLLNSGPSVFAVTVVRL